jgi:glycine/D-amino acid oxidase-like deaminating enzyme
MKPSYPLSRRSLLQSAAAIHVVRAASAQTRNRHVAVVGAGAFGGWTALHLRRRGFEVTLLDAWGPGNSRSSSAGGESRVIRGSYGAKQIYTQMVARSLVLWRENQARWNTQLLHPIGALFLAPNEDNAQRASMKALKEVGLPFEHLTGPESRKRFPQINFEGRDSMVYEQQAGYLMSRRACQTVAAALLKEGGHYKALSAKLRCLTTWLRSCAQVGFGCDRHQGQRTCWDWRNSFSQTSTKFICTAHPLNGCLPGHVAI